MQTDYSLYSTGGIVDHNGKPWRDGYGPPGFSLPPTFNFSSILGSAWRSYWAGRHDDALRNDPEFALAMRRDPQLMSLLQERALAVVSLPWHVESDDDKNPEHKAVGDGLSACLRATPHLKTLLRYMLESTFYGIYGSQFDYRWKPMLLPDPKNPANRIPTRAPIVANHVPVNGDKFVYQFDGTPLLLVNSAKASKLPNAEITLTTKGTAVVLKGTWRDKFLIHHHEAIDADFMHPEQAGSIYGVGIRHYLYWQSWLKKEVLAVVLEFVERQGLGLKVWYYQGGNTTSKAEVEAAAATQTDRTNLIVPRFPNQAGKSSEGVEVVETASAAANLLLDIMRYFDEHLERLVIGQTLSGSSEGNGLGGTGVASLHAATKVKIIAFDADNLAETLTRDWLLKVLAWMYPSYSSVPFRLVFDIDQPDAEQKLNSARALFDMGLPLPNNHLYTTAGVPVPEEGDETTSLAQMQQQQQPQMPVDGDGDGMVNDDVEPDYEGLLAAMGAQ